MVDMADTPAVNIEFNPTNFVTVTLIVLIAFTALGFAARLWQQAA